jgi:hypothetical protein
MEIGLQTPAMIDQDQDKMFNKQDLTSTVGFWRKNNRQMIDQKMKIDESLI